MRDSIVVGIKNFVYRCAARLGEPFLNKLSRAYLLFRDFKGREHIVHYGTQNPDKTIYLIRRKKGSGEGLLSVFTYIMGRIDFVERNGYIPFVDVETEGEPSVFDRYFIQRNGLTREEVFQSKNVLLSGWNSKPVFPGWCNWINMDFNKQKKALLDKHIAFTDEVVETVNRQRAHIRPERCLGLYLRGTDYMRLKPYGHPIQPELQDVKQQIDEMLERLKIEKIFLVTEDYGIYQQVVRNYPDKVVVVQEERFWDAYDGKDMIYKTIEKAGKIEENNLLYLTKIILLSECMAFVGGRTNGSSVANALNGGEYKDRYVYDVGLYQ